MSGIDIKLRRKLDTTVIAIRNDQIKAKLTGTTGQSFLEIKIPIDSVAHDTGNDANHRGFAAMPMDLKILNNQFFISPVVIDTALTNTEDNTSNVQIDISLVVKSKKPWDGTLS